MVWLTDSLIDCHTWSSLTTSQTLTSICPVDDSGDRGNTSAACRPDQESPAGFHVSGPSATSDDPPATRSIQGNKDTVSNDEDPAACSSDGTKLKDCIAALLQLQPPLVALKTCWRIQIPQSSHSFLLLLALSHSGGLIIVHIHYFWSSLFIYFFVIFFFFFTCDVTLTINHCLIAVEATFIT